MNGLFASRTTAVPPLYWMQNAAIFAACANLFSTALANLGFVVFLALFFWTCASKNRRHLDSQNFPRMVAAAIALHLAWQIVGLSYTDAPMAHALKSIFTDRKIIYVLPLVLVFSDVSPKRRFLIAFLGTSSVALALSFALKVPVLNPALKFNPAWVLHSHATQGMVFAMCSFLAAWFASQCPRPPYKFALYALALAFLLNLAWITPGRSGYVVFLVLLVVYFFFRRGFKGLVAGLLVAAVVGGAAFLTSSSIRDRVMEGVTEAQKYSSDVNETSLGRRMVMYETTWEMIRQNPVLGVGTGGFEQQFSAMAAKKYTGWRAMPFHDPHNQYLFVWSENGLIGLGIFVFLLLTIWRQSMRGDVYANMAGGCLLAWCATSLFSGHFRTFPEGHMIAFIVGILMISRHPRADESRPSGGDGLMNVRQ